MLQQRTVLVLGAGSSVEFGMPDGAKLASSIAASTNFNTDLTSGDYKLYRAALNLIGPPDGTVFNAGRKLAAGLPLSKSIDDFLYNHGDDRAMVTLGKMAIVQRILEGERSSRLIEYADGQADAGAFDRLQDTWLYRLFRFLQTDVRRDQISQVFDRFAIINFNYDRCVETFLLVALQRAYGVSREEAGEVLKHLDITHPYGQVGVLPWQDGTGEKVAFGDEIEGERLGKVVEQIRTYTEQAHSDEDRAHWRDIISGAQQVVFLGFAFHKQNVELLHGNPNPVNHAFGTAYGASAQDQVVFTRRIETMLGGANFCAVKLEEMTAAAFVDAFGLRLTS